MAISQTYTYEKEAAPFRVIQTRVTGMTSGTAENVDHGFTGALPFMVQVETIVSPAVGGVTYEHIVASDSATNGTISLLPRSTPGGDITSAEALVTIWFRDTASGSVDVSPF